MKKFLISILLVSGGTLKAQPFVKHQEILVDSVKIKLDHFRNNGGVRPMDTQCLSFSANTDYKGGVIVEILGVCTNNLCNFRAYCDAGIISTCTSWPKISPLNNSSGIMVNGNETKYVRVRKDVSWKRKEFY